MAWLRVVCGDDLDEDSFLSQTFESAFIRQVQDVVKQWRNGQELFTLTTSGSTGSPKQIVFDRSTLINSARSTLQYLSIDGPGNTFLLTLLPAYTGGFMMLIRALVSNANLILIEPSSDWLQLYASCSQPMVDLCALTPLQAIELSQASLSVQKQFKNVLLGGAALPPHLVEKLKKAPFNIYETFGMTETASHFALKNLKTQTRFVPLPGYEIKTDTENRLLVKGPATKHQWLLTQDVVQIDADGSFEWLGRSDFVINSGGIKLHPEKLEYQIATIFNSNNIQLEFAISSMPDQLLGEKAVLAVAASLTEEAKKQILQLLKQAMPPYHAPKEIVCLTTLPRANNHKLNRKALKQWILQHQG